MKSEHINELAAALAKAQAKIRGAVKDSANPFFKSSYADLQSVWDAIREPLAANGLCVIQTTATNAAGGLELITTLAHSSGQWIEGRFPVLPLKNEPQAVGSAVSYSRRYSLAAIAGVYQTDDDAEQAQARNASPTPATFREPVKATAPAPKPATQATLIPEPKVAAATGSLGAPFDLILQKGEHAGKQIQDLTPAEAKAYFDRIDGELKAVNRSPATLRGPGRDVYYALAQYIELKKGNS